MRSRSFPFMPLAVLVLLLFTLSLAFAEEKKEDARKKQEQNAPAAASQAPGASHGQGEGRRDQRDAGRPDASRGPQPQVASPGRYQPASPTPVPSWQAPGRSGESGTGRTERGRSDQANPYSRYRQQPGNEPQTAPSGRRWTRPESSGDTTRQRTLPSPQQSGERRRGDVGWYPRTRPEPRATDNGRPSPGTAQERWRPRTQDTPNTTDLPRQTPRSNRDERTNGRTSGDRGSRGPIVGPGTRPGQERPQAPNRARGTQGTPPAAPRDRLSDRVRTRVPEAKFRGPVADRRVVRAPQRPEELGARLRQGVRQWNTTSPVFKGGRLTRDVVGHEIPRNARYVDRQHVVRTHTSYVRVEGRLGRPTNYYSFIPRYPGDYAHGYWDGYEDGYWDGRAYRPHPAVVINLYYGYYYSDPLWFGFYYPGYYASIYHYYGYCPGWVYPTRVYVYPSDYIYWPADPYRYYARTQVDEFGAQRAIGDIRRAWLNNELDLFTRHLTDDLDVQVYFDGEYQYTTSTEDYYGMTADALASTETVSLTFDSPIFLSSHEVFYTGRHVFYDPDGNRQTVYVSYRLRKLGAEWYLVAVGSSLEPIQHQYTDFRYDY